MGAVDRQYHPVPEVALVTIANPQQVSPTTVTCAHVHSQTEHILAKHVIVESENAWWFGFRTSARSWKKRLTDKNSSVFELLWV